jgi:maltooligosyltrehalose trehalohydrolase
MSAFIAFLENHDQVSNSLLASRLWQQSHPACHRAMTALLLLGPWTPLLFQGQEWSSSRPFQFFADHKPDLARLVRAGRTEFLSQFPAVTPDRLADPASPPTFATCKLDWDERAQPLHERALALHRDLITLRNQDPTLRGAHTGAGVSLEFAPLTPVCGLLRYFVDGTPTEAQRRDRLLLINLGPDIDLGCPAQPLLAPPAQATAARWRILWSSENPRYGGHGIVEPQSESGEWTVPGSAAVLLGPEGT